MNLRIRQEVEEMTERAKLREEYLNAIRQNFKQTLDNIEIIDKGE